MLTGPAFPPAWIISRSMSYLAILDVSGNRGLTGTLPAEWSFWPSVMEIYAGRTSLHGSVPRQWCGTGTHFQDASNGSRLQEVYANDHFRLKTDHFTAVFHSSAEHCVPLLVSRSHVEETLIDITLLQSICLMSDERRHWRVCGGSSNATVCVATADRMAPELLRGNSAPFLSALASPSGSLGLLLGALVIAAIAGWRLQRKRQARQQQRLHHQGAVQQPPNVIHLKLQRRSRLNILLQAALDDQNAPLEFWPKWHTHQLGDDGRWVFEEESSPLFSPAGAGAGSDASHASAGALGSRRWGLASHSLQLTPDAIQVSACVLCCMHLRLLH